MLGIYFHLLSTWWTLSQWNSCPLSTVISIQIIVFIICRPKCGFEQNKFTGVANSLSRLCNFILIMFQCLILVSSSLSFRLSYVLHMFGKLRYYSSGPVVVELLCRFLTVLYLQGISNFFVTWKLNGGLSVSSESHDCFPFISISVMKLLE